MCGFIGSAIFSGRGSPEVPAAVVGRVHWRGPDAYSQESWDDHSMGSSRLAVIDPTPEANQPLTSLDHRWDLVYNGEIFNYAALAAEHRLSELAHRSDSWTLLELITQFGVVRACESLRGMYAFAAWERTAGRLWLARDPFGIKPLAWTRIEAGVLFGSDPRTLACWRSRFVKQRSLDAYALTHFMMLGYIPGDATVWDGIERVQPGEVIAFDRNDSTHHIWKPLVSRERDKAVTVDELDAAIQASVARHLVADVDIGAFLSGGLDSSLVTAVARRMFGAPMRTYSIGFDSNEVPDESLSAARIASRLGTTHTTQRLEASGFRALAEAVAEAFPEPHADPASIPTLALSRRACDDVKVVLTGEGGDEMFGGYRRFWALPLARGPLGRTANVVGLTKVVERVGGRRVRQAADSVVLDAGAAYLRYLTQLHWDALTPASPICTPALVARVIARYEMESRKYPTPTSMRDLELHRHLPESYLEKTDRATMRHGLEARVPFLDLDLASVALSLDDRSLARPGRTKVLLRKVAARHLPASVAAGPKRGFSVPLRTWMSERNTYKWVVGSLLDGEATQRGIFEKAALRRVIATWCDLDRGGNAEALYRLLSLELWCRSAGHDGAL